MSDKVHVELVCDRSQFEDTLYKSGVTWAGKGDVQTVTAEQWDKMKKHADVWREVNPDAPQKQKPAAEESDTDPALAEANAKIAATLADLDNMTDDAVREFAASLDVKPHHKKTGIALRGAVREALA